MIRFAQINGKFAVIMRQRVLAALMVVLTVVGCEPSAPPKPKIVIQKDAVRLEPGPVDADAPTEFTTTESGLKYRLVRKSDGPKPTDDSVVRIHFRGRLADGTIFDSSYGSTGQSVEYPVKGFIKGWVEGLKLVGEGGMIELEVPPELGYGDKKTGDIPPNSPLFFTVELLQVK